ncbi:MAG: hypothetical protein U5Q03_08370 [Bacteroidota bacterium]|nr:hypothetical protein [Bacteroidota bacterium]
MEQLYKLTGKRNLLILIPAFCFLFFVSCDKFESDQTVPAYIKIDSISLYTDFNTQGSASHNITDAWVYVDDILIGGFELPCTVPVLYEGVHRITVKAGIKVNGIATLRSPYPFYKSIEIEGYELRPNSILDFRDTMKTTYTDETNFAWVEDFQAGISIVDATKSDTTIMQTSDPLLAFQDPNSEHTNRSGLIRLTADKDLYEGAGPEGIPIPTTNSVVMMEIDFRIDNVLTTGLWVDTYSSIKQEAILNLNTTEKWKKVYVNFTPAVQRNTDAFSFKAFIGAPLTNGTDEATILIDNIKLLYR